MTVKELWKLICQEDLEPIWEGPLDTWRWGTVHDEVYEIEGRFWRVSYRISNEGETHDLRDGNCADPWEVEPKEEVITRTIYVKKQ